MMTPKQYDISKNPDYAKRQMFLDGNVTIQRYDEFAYPKIAALAQEQRGAHWVPEEISLVKDKADFLFTANLLRQTALDSFQSKTPIQVFAPVCSIPELESLMNAWSYFEEIHSRTYSYIIRSIYNVPSEQFNAIHDTAAIVSMASNIGKYYHDLHLLNCKVDLSLPVTEHEHIKAIWMALVASYGLEAIRFNVSFPTSIAMGENKIFIGNTDEIKLIQQDEMLHAKWTKYIMNQICKDDPRFAQVRDELQKEAYDALLDCIDEEKEWAKYLFKEGSVIGLNEHMFIDFVDWSAADSLKGIGIKHKIPSRIKSTPLPWYTRSMNTNKQQTANQEKENTAYVAGQYTSELSLSDLPDITL
jgi:ribonucleoside-diphosphate reductase beta chain